MHLPTTTRVVLHLRKNNHRILPCMRKFILVSLGEFQSWSVVFDTEYIANQKMVQINAFELSLNLQYKPTLNIAWFSCNLQNFVADFREITPNRADAWYSAL